MNTSKRKCPNCGTTLSEFGNTCPVCYQKIEFVKTEEVKENEEQIEKELVPREVTIPPNLTKEEMNWLLCRIATNPEGRNLIRNYASNNLDYYWQRYLEAVFIYSVYH